MIARAVALFFGIAVAACAMHTVAPRCSFGDFEPAPYDHIIERLPDVTVAELTGRFKVRERDVVGGIWPPRLDARMELHGPNGFREFIEANEDGTFARKGLRPGTYCFKASASGFRSMLGTVVIDRSMRQHPPFEIELMISE